MNQWEEDLAFVRKHLSQAESEFLVRLLEKLQFHLGRLDAMVEVRRRFGAELQDSDGESLRLGIFAVKQELLKRLGVSCG